MKILLSCVHSIFIELVYFKEVCLMAVINTRQIAKSNNKTKLIEFNDKMQYNDFSEQAGLKKSTIHNKFSRIVATIVDWSNGKGDKAIVVNHNITPLNMKTIAQMVLSGDTQPFEQIDKYSKKTGYYEQKIDHRTKNSEGYSPVTRFNIRYQANMVSPWTITIENGIGIAVISDIGGVSIKGGSYKEIRSATVYLSRTEMMTKMIEVRDYINAFEHAFMWEMLQQRDCFEKKLAEEYRNNKQ